MLCKIILFGIYCYYCKIKLKCMKIIQNKISILITGFCKSNEKKMQYDKIVIFVFKLMTRITNYIKFEIHLDPYIRITLALSCFHTVITVCKYEIKLLNYSGITQIETMTSYDLVLCSFLFLY